MTLQMWRQAFASGRLSPWHAACPAASLAATTGRGWGGGAIRQGPAPAAKTAWPAYGTALTPLNSTPCPAVQPAADWGGCMLLTTQVPPALTTPLHRLLEPVRTSCCTPMASRTRVSPPNSPSPNSRAKKRIRHLTAWRSAATKPRWLPSPAPSLLVLGLRFPVPPGCLLRFLGAGGPVERPPAPL